MTMKTTKTPSAILSRVGVAAFLAAGLAVTAPITIASAQDDPTVETKMKKVLKWVENENGVETTKTYEIVKENGVKTVYSIDEHGNKTLVSEDELGDMPMMGGDIEFMVLGDGEAGEKNIKIIGDGDLHAMGDGQHGKVMIKRMKKSADGQEVDVDKNVFVFKGEGDTGSHASAMVSAAKQLLDQVDSMENGDELSARAQRKLEKARKALDEAQEALDAE